MNIKNENLELRIVLIGETGVGKKSIVNRFKILHCTETKEIPRNKESIEEKVKKLLKKKSDKNKDNANNLSFNDTKSKTKSDLEDFSKEEIEQKKLELKKEEKRLDLMNFTKLYKINISNFEINFYPCKEAQPLPYNYEFKEDDKFYDFEKEYKLTLKPLIKELEQIIIKPAENPNTQIEFLFLLCFDLSDINSFEKLLLYFNQIEKHFKLSSNFKLVLIGNKLDKKTVMSNEQKEGINNLISQLNALYYEISTLMFYPFEKFFEKLIFDNFGELPLFSSKEAKKYFIEILNQKQSFPKAKREYYKDNKYPSSNKYNTNPFQYPYKRREFLKIFHDTDKFNKKIFINKTGTLFPPLKKNKEKEFTSYNKDRSLKDKKREIYTFESNKKVQEEIELNSRKPGKTFGIITYKPLNLKQRRKFLSESRDTELDRFLTEGGTTLYRQVKSMNKGEFNQEKYAKNRLEQQKRINEDKKKINDDIKKRHDEVNEKNLMEANEKIELVLKKDKKYTKRYEERERKRIKKQKQNIIKNNSESEIPKRFSEPKGKFYTPMSSISTNRGFTFGHKCSNTIVKQDYPDYPLFKDDFEKLILKNKKINFVKQKGKRFPEYKTDEVGDSTYIMENQKKFEKNRNLIKTNKISGFLLDRKNKREEVLQRKKEIIETQENDLKEQILKQYKTDSNYLIREINYNQVENSSPKYTMRNKYEFGSIFQHDKQTISEDSNNQFGYSTLFNPDVSTKLSTLNLENPDFSYIRPKYPVYSFTKSKRFSFTTDNFDRNKSKYTNTEVNLPLTNYYDYTYTQSFLKAQTSMGTGKKFEIKGNGFPGPDIYKIPRFADEVVKRGNEINLARIKVREKEKLDKIDRDRRAKLREQWQEEKRFALKMSLKESLFNNNINNSINNDNNSEQITEGQIDNNFIEKNHNSDELTL